MTQEELIQALAGRIPGVEADTTGEWPAYTVEPADWPALAEALKSDTHLQLDYLFCLTCVDWKTHLTMVYHLTSTMHRQPVVIKSTLDRADPRIPTVSAIWRTAEFHEREVHELFGVVFEGHPDLRKLILPDDWEGFPLRKDYEDPVNMIKL